MALFISLWSLDYFWFLGSTIDYHQVEEGSAVFVFIKKIQCCINKVNDDVLRKIIERDI